MKTSRIPVVIFALLLIGYVLFLCYTFSLLPERMATHFGASGRPNGWMRRSSAVVLQGVIGLVVPLIIAVVFWAIRFVPVRAINFPRRDFWFAPERRDETCLYLSRQGLWLGSLMVGLQAVVWWQVVEGNRAGAAQLSTSGFWAALAVFGAAMIVWVLGLVRHFGKLA